MIKNEKILKYILNELSEREKEDFENHLKVSSELQNQVDAITLKLNKLNNLNEIKTDGQYFVNIYPRFLQKLDEEKTRIPFHKFAVGLSFVLILLFTISIGIKNGLLPNQMIDKNELTNEIEILSYLNSTYNYSANPEVFVHSSFNDSTLISGAIADYLIEKTSIRKFMDENHIDIRAVYEDLSDDEFDNYYAELTESEFL